MAKKLSNNSIDKIIKCASSSNKEINIVCEPDGGTVSFMVSWDSDISKRMQSIMDGVSLSWDEEGNFLPAISSLSYAYALLSCFTNIKTERVEKIYTLTQLTNIIETVEETLPIRVYKDFKHDFNECFDSYKKKAMRLSNVDSLCESLVEIVSKFGNIVENITPETISSIFDAKLESNEGSQLSLVDKDE